MDQKGERKENHLWLPPNYVSLADLQERWLQKQREKEMMEKQKEDEMSEKRKEGEMRETQKEEEMRAKQPEAKLNENQKLRRGWLEKGSGSRRGENNGGRENGRAIADKGKQKEIPVGGFGNKTHHKKKKNRYSRVVKSEKGNEVEKEKLEIETENDVNGGESKEVLSAVKGGNADFKDGLSRSCENLVTNHTTKRENGVRFNRGKDGAEVEFSTEKKMVEKKGYSRNWGKTRRNRNYRLKEINADVSKGKVVEKDSENKALHGNSEVCSKTGDLKGGQDKDNRVEYHGVKDEGIDSDPKAEAMVLPMESLKIDENSGGSGNGFNWRYGNQRRNNGRQYRVGSGSNDWNGKSDDARRYGRFGRFEGDGKTKARGMDGMMWVRKEDRSRAVDGAP